MTSERDTMLNPLQQTAVGLAANGHNFCLTGQAGTGKTYTVKLISAKLKSEGKTVNITCTTGMACMQYYGSDVGTKANTLHAWSGIRDGRFRSIQLIKLLQTNEKFAVCRDNIKTTDVLIIDEISMLSRTMFEQFETICRAVRESDIVFGGMQVIGVGDFYQLPPVPSPEYGDNGMFCLTSDMWLKCFPHHVDLQEVVRQDEPELVRAIAELSRGNPSDETNKLLKALSRPLSEEDNRHTVKLFARNLDVDFVNDEMLSSLDGEAVTFKSIDSGSPTSLKRIRVQKHITLKVGCPVILISNLTSPLVNGLHGIVKNINSDGPTVFFPSVGITQTVNRFTFTIYNRNDNSMSASRQQLPLKLAYALTIHKSQGMTLPLVDVDCRGATFPGQIAVAIGRSIKISGLRVTNYHPALVKKPLPEVEQFYIVNRINEDEDVSLCCRNCVTVDMIEHSVIDISTEESDFSDFTPHELREVEEALSSIESQHREREDQSPSTSQTELDPETDYPPDYFNPMDVFNSLNYTNPATEEQLLINTTLEKLNQTPDKVALYGNIVWRKLNREFTTHCKDLQSASEATKSKKLGKYHSAVFTLFTDKDLLTASNELFQETSDDTVALCNKFILRVSTHLLKWKSYDVQKPASEPEKTMKDMSEDGKGKVRYVGGMCVAKLKFKYMTVYRNNIHSKKKTQRKTAEDCKNKIAMLGALEESYGVLVDTTAYPQSLEHTKRKQNLRCSLTNISDECLELFLHIELKRTELSTFATFNREKENALMFIKQQITNDDQLRRHFMEIVKGFTMDETNKTELFNKLIERYTNVGNAEYRKQLKEKFIKKKKFAHRVSVATAGAKKGETGTTKKTVSSSTIIPSTSTTDTASVSLEPSTSMTDTASVSLEPSTSLTDTASVSLEPSLSTIDTASVSLEPSTSMTDTASVSTSESSKSKGSKRPAKGKGKGKSSTKVLKKTEVVQDEKKYFCASCDNLYAPGDQWICCDNCNAWYDRKCSGLDEDTEWEDMVDSEREWICAKCNNETNK